MKLSPSVSSPGSAPLPPSWRNRPRACAIKSDDVAELTEHGYSDAEMFDIVAIAAGRASWVGRIEFVAPQRLDEPEFRAVG